MSTAESPLAAPMNHVFVDFENVPDIDLSVIGGKATTFNLFLGAKNTKLDVTLVEKLLAHAATVNFIRLTSFGKNALDFTLAYYVGRAAVNDPHGFFHIIATDTGYDPLIEHLRSRRLRAHRYPDFASFTSAGKPRPTTLSPPVDNVVTKALEHLRKNKSNQAKTRKGLVSVLQSISGKPITEANVGSTIDSLIQAGRLVIDEKDKVVYHL